MAEPELPDEGAYKGTDAGNTSTADELVAWAVIEQSRLHRGRKLLDDRGAMSVDEFCGWASIGRSKFYQEVGAGRIRLRKIGRKSVVTMPDALAWLSNLPVAAWGAANDDKGQIPQNHPSKVPRL